MAELTKSLASTRQRRPNAGQNMSRLLDKVEEDEFYQTQYGGFDEIENDNDYNLTDSSDSENVIDSDFDIDEAPNNIEDEDYEEKMIKQEEKCERRAMKKKSVYYKRVSTGKKVSKVDTAKSGKISNRPRTVSREISKSDPASMYKNLRESTKKISRKTKANLESRKIKKRMKNMKNYHYPTQEQLLREAEITEIENMQTFEYYKNLEIEKSKRNKMKKIPNVPMIRYHSYRDITENGDKTEPCNRTIISFPDEHVFNQYFERYVKKNDLFLKQRDTSFLSNLPVRYRDPLTSFQYAKSKEFDIIRNAYIRFLQQSSVNDNELIKKFINLKYKKLLTNNL